MKVFVTVGSMLPFDRLVQSADGWAATHPDAVVVAQTGEGGWRPRAMAHHAMLAPQDYRRHCSEADLIVSHVGMGTVITAAELHKPLIVLPRQRTLGEVTSDHQVATARWLRGRPGVTVIDSVDELPAAIAAAASGGALTDFGQAGRERLVACLRDFVIGALHRR